MGNEAVPDGGMKRLGVRGDALGGHRRDHDHGIADGPGVAAVATEKTRTPSRALSRLVFSHAANTVSQPSSLVRAVSSETLSVGA